MTEQIAYLKTRFGGIEIGSTAGSITLVKFVTAQKEITKMAYSELSNLAFNQLEDYFAGKQKCFELPIDLKGTDFQKKVWNTILQIPYGKTATYKEIANIIGNSGAVRAVGLASNKNPINILIPCHRVIGSNGKLIGYAGGIEIKRKLLVLEQNKKNQLF